MDDVNCDGGEASLENCAQYGWNRHNCRHYEDAGVRCGLSDETGMVISIYITTELHIYNNNISRIDRRMRQIRCKHRKFESS